jgi:hypothetical protein
LRLLCEIRAALVFSYPAKCGLPRARGTVALVDACALMLKRAPLDLISLARSAHEVFVLGRCLWHTLKIFIFQCTMRGTKHHGLGEVASAGPSPLARAQSSWVLRACYFLGEGPSIDTVPSPHSCGVQQKISGLHAITMSCRSRGRCTRFNLVFVLKSILSYKNA